MENNQLEKAIENLFMIEQCRFRDIDVNEIEAIGYLSMSFNFSEYYKFMHNPLVQQKIIYTSLNPSKPRTAEKTTLVSDFIPRIHKRYSNKRGKNMFEKIRYYFVRAPDKDNFIFELDEPFTDWKNMTFWLDGLVIPIYHGNKDYELVKNESIKKSKGE